MRVLHLSSGTPSSIPTVTSGTMPSYPGFLLLCSLPIVYLLSALDDLMSDDVFIVVYSYVQLDEFGWTCVHGTAFSAGC